MKIIKIFSLVLLCCFALTGCKEKAQEEQTQESVYTNFEMVVDDVFTIAGRGTVATGNITVGDIKAGDVVYIQKSDGSYLETEIVMIEQSRKEKDSATVGDNVGLLLKDINRQQVVAGDVIVN